MKQQAVALLVMAVAVMFLSNKVYADDALEQALIHASEVGDKADVESLIAKGANVNYVDSFGKAPLIAAVSSDHKDIAELLIIHGANVNLNNFVVGMRVMPDLSIQGQQRDLDPPLYWAIKETDISMVEMLLLHGAHVNGRSAGSEPLLDIAIAGGNADIVSMLLANGADVNVKDMEGGIPLAWAIKQGKENIVEVLLAHGADVNIKDRSGYPLLNEAVSSGNKEIIKTLLRVANTEAINSVLNLAFSRQNDEIKGLLLPYVTSELLAPCDDVTDDKSYSLLLEYFAKNKIEGDLCQRLNDRAFVYEIDYGAFATFNYCVADKSAALKCEDSSNGASYPGINVELRFTGAHGKQYVLFSVRSVHQGDYSKGYFAFYLVSKKIDPRGFTLFSFDAGETDFSGGEGTCEDNQRDEKVYSRSSYKIINENQMNVVVHFEQLVTDCKTNEVSKETLEYTWQDEGFQKSKDHFDKQAAVH